MSRRIEDVVASLKDETRPLPALVWAGLALLVSASLFLTLRLLVVQRLSVSDRPLVAEASRPVLDVPVRRAEPGGPTAAGAAGGRAGVERVTTPPPPVASEEAFRTLVEGWRAAWVRKDLNAFVAYYAPTFAADGKDLNAWREHKARVFASPVPVDVRIEDVRVALHEAIAVVSFTQDYRSGSYEDRGTKSLYLLPRDGRWLIFFEEWKSLDAAPRGGRAGGT